MNVYRIVFRRSDERYPVTKIYRGTNARRDALADLEDLPVEWRLTLTKRSDGEWVKVNR